MVSRRRLGLACCIALAALLLLAPATDADRENRFVYADAAYPVLDPAGMRLPNDERLVLAMFDGLTALDPVTARVVPAAATRWEEAADGKSWTFHLRRGAKWSDGTPVKARDFVAAWQRVVDPFSPSPWVAMFRPLRGCAAMADGDRAMRALSAAGKGLEALLGEHEKGVPGKELSDLVERSGVRPYAEEIDDAAVRKLLRWGEDNFPRDRAEAARKAFKDARKAVKRGVYDAFDAFGTEVGARAENDHTLVVLLEGRCPWLPRLVGRGAFVPLHPDTLAGGSTAFESRNLATNGAYQLKGRGSRPRAGVPNPPSVVHLIRSATYDGPRKGRMEEILCYTGQGPEEDLRRLQAGEMQWMASAPAAVKDEASKLPGLKTRGAGRLILLRLRVDRKPFDKLDVRRAFALALNRKKLARSLWPEPAPAWRLVPSATSTTAAPRSPPEDRAAAERALKEAGISGAKLPWVELHYEEGLDDVADDLLRLWEKGLGVEMGLRIESAEEARLVRAAGAFQIALGDLGGGLADPAAWLLTYARNHPASGLGWEDEGFEALLAAASDIDALIAGGDEALAKLPDGATYKAKLATARASATAREHLRLALLEAAERRLLDACVVIPLLWPSTASVEAGVRGLGSDSAWRLPSFFGDLRAAQR
jgi:ABC-type oligopeptide transport system substrate-binding subunit